MQFNYRHKIWYILKHTHYFAYINRFPLAEDVDLEEIVDKCPPHLSGADFYSLCSNAVIQRVEKNVEILEKGFLFLFYSMMIYLIEYSDLPIAMKEL